uniref:Uncharacterized protein n=1 Tax=Oryza barthii TaxID=65489 RepID=A0A0D3H6B4_9ORYZ
MKGPQDDTCAHKVRNDFMARYKWPDDQPDLKEKWIKTLEKCCEKLATQEIYQERIYGRSFSIIEAYTVHMGASKQAVAEGQGNDLPPIPDERAQENMDKYRDGMQAAHGPNVIWVRAPLDAQVMYECTGRKAHGKFAMADGAIDSSEVQLSTNAHPSHTYTYMMNGSASTPPPQINLAALFPSHSSPTTQQNTTDNSSRNVFNQIDGNNSGNCSQQDAGLSNNEHGDMGNNSENVALQRMDGSTFGYSSQQTAHATNQGNSKRGGDGDYVDSEDDYADDGNYDDVDETPEPFVATVIVDYTYTK